MEEIWKDIKGYEGLYQVSNLGNVRSLDRYKKNNKGKYLQRGVVLKKNHDKDGYSIVGLYKSGNSCTKKVHRLVAQAFIPNPKNKPTVNHKNGIRDDDKLSNLEWATMSENQLHAFRVLKRKPVIPNKEQIEKSLKSKYKKVIQYEMQIIIKETARYGSIKEAEKTTGINCTSISRCCRKKQEKTGKYLWRFENDEIKDKD